MSQRKTILVIGSTGQQGGSVLRHLLADPEKTFNVRALVRDATSDKTKLLLQTHSAAHQEGRLEIAVGDLSDLNSLTKSMQGCYGVFGVTNFWDPTIRGEGEIQHGKNMGEACRQTGIQHLVFSTLDKNSGVPHFESKVLAENHISAMKIPTTWLVTSFYYENFINYFPPKPDGSGGYVLSLALKPTTRVPMYACSDTGGYVLPVFLDPKRYIGHDVAAVSEDISIPEICETAARVTGKPWKFEEQSIDFFRSLGFPGAEEFALNWQFFNDISEGKKENRREGSALKTGFKGENWEQFLRRTKLFT
jgi:uncharacterized protein YbjT (DUF2867 family)